MTGFVRKPMPDFVFFSHAALSRALRGSHIATYAALLAHGSPCLEKNTRQEGVFSHE